MMNKKQISAFISLASLFLALQSVSAKEPDTRELVGLMGSQPAAQVVVNDAAMKKAIEALIKQQEKKIEIKKKFPEKLDNPLGQKHAPINTDKVLILGDAVPM